MSPAGPDSGLRGYINVSGGFDTPPVLGSQSTHIGARLGGIEGRALESDDQIPIGPVTNPVLPERRVPQHLLPQYGGDIVVRVVPGPQDDLFDSDATATFYNSTYTVSDKSDRMGCRLEGPEVPAINGEHDIVSDGVLSGAIQIPGDAQPIILLADRQTTGGYAKIGVITSIDLALVAQASPGATVRFEQISAEDAAALARDRMVAMRGISFETPASVTSQPDELRREYDLQIDGSDYRVEITSGVVGGQTTAVVNGIEYVLQVHPGE
jgi:biotin-dependent carboxylase-like uncharacterized protein